HKLTNESLKSLKNILNTCRKLFYYWIEKDIMNHISTGLIRSLKTLGLSEYEARAYSALVMHDHAEAKELVEFLDISKPSVYGSLQSLEDMGLVVIANSKPATYRAVSPDMAVKLLMD